MIGYVPVAGTNGWNDAWAVSNAHPFPRMMNAHGFAPIRLDGRAFRWSTTLDGIFGDDRQWEAGADALYWFLRDVPYADRNLVAHSHGGQVAILCAASGCRIRTLTTVGTPPRSDMPVDVALKYLGFWQHLYDRRRDWWGWAGQCGEGSLDLSRSFKQPAIRNIPLDRIDHAKILRDEKQYPLWHDLGLHQNIRTMGGLDV